MKRFLDAATPQARPTIAMAALCALAVLAKGGGVAVAAPVEFGVDRSNMGTQWTLAWPQEPKVSPFLTSDYNKPGNFRGTPGRRDGRDRAGPCGVVSRRLRQGVSRPV